MKLGRLIAIFIGLGIGCFACRVVWMNVLQRRAELKDIKREVRAEEIKRNELAKRKAALENEATRERIAREHGWYREGEKPL